MNKKYKLWEDARARVLQRAKNDPVFRTLLMTNPRQAIESELAVRIPSNVQFHVHEDSSADFHLVLQGESGELADQDLDAAAGGRHDPVLDLY